jgi:hypothetical protein
MRGGETVFELVCDGQPPTANKALRPDGVVFLDRVHAAAASAGWQMQSGLLRGAVYWFIWGYDQYRHPDADNLSKRVWDRLQGFAYEDDKQVRVRTAAVIDLVETKPESGSIALDQIDVSRLPQIVVEALDRLLDTPLVAGRVTGPSFTYVELGPLDYGWLSFSGGRTVAATGDDP